MKETAEEFTQLGEQYTKVFEPLNADQIWSRPNVLCTACKPYIALPLNELTDFVRNKYIDITLQHNFKMLTNFHFDIRL